MVMIESEFEVSVGMSRKWDAREAGREVARSTIEKLNRPPSFFLLFSTIHYEKHGGFEEFLNGVWDVLPTGTPLVGGTFAGFMNNYGCYTRGCTAIAVSYPNMDVAVGIGHNTKRNPKRAAKNCANMINFKLKDSRYSHKFIFDVISGGLVPQIPGIGRKKVIRGTLSKNALSLSNVSLTVFQKGVGREEEILNEFVKYFDGYYILHGSSMDDAKAMNNYQFANKEVGTNMIVALGINIDLGMNISSIHNLKEMKRFCANKLSKDGRTIQQINNKPAAEEFLNLLGWPEEYFDERLFKRTFFYPLGFKENGDWIAEAIGIVAGNNLVVLHGIKDKNMAVLEASGQNMMEAVTKSLKTFDHKEALIGLVTSCDTRLEALGSQIFKVYDKMIECFNNVPFVIVYCGGEGGKKPHEKLKYGNVTFNSFVIKNN